MEVLPLAIATLLQMGPIPLEAAAPILRGQSPELTLAPLWRQTLFHRQDDRERRQWDDREDQQGAIPMSPQWTIPCYCWGDGAGYHAGQDCQSKDEGGEDREQQCHVELHHRLQCLFS